MFIINAAVKGYLYFCVYMYIVYVCVCVLCNDKKKPTGVGGMGLPPLCMIPFNLVIMYPMCVLYNLSLTYTCTCMSRDSAQCVLHNYAILPALTLKPSADFDDVCVINVCVCVCV